MEKTITITEEEYRKLVSETTAEITAKHSEDAPQAALLFSLSCITFSAALAHKLFPEGEDNKTADPESYDDSISPETMRKELHKFCRGRDCVSCPLSGKEFICGRGHYFTCPPDDPVTYMDDKTIIRHYKKMKEYENE